MSNPWGTLPNFVLRLTKRSARAFAGERRYVGRVRVVPSENTFRAIEAGLDQAVLPLMT